MDFTDAELDLLVGDGFEVAYMGDIKLNDLVAIPPVIRSDLGGGSKTVKTVVVTRIRCVGDVMVFIGTDLDGRPHHMSYGNTYPCFIKREGE